MTTVLLGQYALSGALLTALAIVLAAFGFWRTGNAGLVRAARWGQVLLGGLLAVAAWGLLKALLDDNFKLAYVVHHSEKSLGLGYKIAAFWAGQEGSLLFWAFILGVMGVMLAWRFRKATDATAAIVFATMAAVTGFFICVMLFAGDPFTISPEKHANGQGLNPALQNLAMVFHPPLLFLGYAGFTAPFAIMLGGLLGGQKDGRWLNVARPWMVFSWIMLTAGIVLGAQWAYVDLGWGGYWAWDPVENASLLPWFTGTALLHSAVLQARRGIFKRWTASLTAASFFLCVLGTYLTRSGVIQSLHAFEESPIGTFFLVFLVAIGLVSAAVILLKLHVLKAEHPLEEIVSREGFFLLGNVLLCLMTAATVVGTIWPLISGGLGGTPVTVGAPFYNKIILPMALLLAGLMSTGPVLGQGQGAAEKARNKLAGMLLAGAEAGAVIFMLGYSSLWALMAAAVVGAVAAGVAIDLSVAWRGRGEQDAGAVVRTFTHRPRHWGAQVAHLGMAALVAGVAGSSLYGQSQDIQFHAGDKGTRVGGYVLTLKGLNEIRRENHGAVVATITLRNAQGQTMELAPERRFYDQGMGDGQSASVVAIKPGLFSDVYLSLAGWEGNGSLVTITAMINPMVNWIWAGGVLLALGGLLCLVPQGKPVAVTAEAPVASPVPETLMTGKTRRERRRAMTAPAVGRHA